MGERKSRQLSGQMQSPRQREQIAQAFRALGSGDLEHAHNLYRQLLEALPQDADAMVGLGVLGMQLGDGGNAEKLLRLAVAKRPKAPAYRGNLAIVLSRLGRNAEAIAELRRALNLDPRLVEAHTNLGIILLGLRDASRVAEAAAAFQRALALDPDNTDALLGLGNAQLAMGRREQGCMNLERAVAIDPGLHQAYASLASARMRWAAELERNDSGAAGLANEQIARGIDSISTALQLCPENPLYWEQYAEHIKNVRIRYPLDARACALLSRALNHPNISPTELVPTIVGLVNTHPEALELKRVLSSAGTFDGLSWQAIGHHVRSVLEEPLLLQVLRDAVIPDMFLERLVVFARSAMLSEALALSEPSLPAPAIAALAHYGFNTEYVGDESPEDAARVDTLADCLRHRHVSNDHVPAHWYAVYGAYRPLHTLHTREMAEQVARELASTPYHEVAVRQITEPQREHELRASIIPQTRVVNDVSRMVRSLYETNPYPRWIRPVRLSASQNATLRETMQSLFPHADFSGISESPPRILIAGCGTGEHPINTAQRFRDASVLAVDLSLTSLAYAKRMTLELGITNIEYRQSDILELASLSDRFDIIECSGVLHHLQDPLAGWRVLCGLLRPGGLMNIGLYSDIARRHIVRARELIAADGYEATAEGIRRCRAAIRTRAGDALLEKLMRNEDFYSMSGCRDLIFHVQEHRYTLPQIAAVLAALELEFLGFEHPDPAFASTYQARFPDDPALTRLDYWHRFEADHPDTFRGMYQFWVRSRGAVTARQS